MARHALVEPRPRLVELHRDLAGLGSGSHEDVTDLLIACGELEAAVVDALCPERDALIPAIEQWREASLHAGHAFYHSSRRAAAVMGWLGRVRESIERLLLTDMPGRVRVSVPEGYAYYALYPEAYRHAAERFRRTARCDRIVVVGIRSIGTSLSAVVAAALEEQGCEVHTVTLRPRGHPFDRRPQLAPDLARRLSALREATFLIVDEGPGLSGSSMAGVAAVLEQLGVSEEHIVLMPSWVTDGRTLVSDDARQRWPRYSQYVASFETVAPFPLSDLLDWSAGRWREFVYADEQAFPPAHPQHERRKYVRTVEAPDAVLKFVGLTRYGRTKLALAEELAAAGFTPPVLGLANGFLATRFVRGRPLSRADVGPPLLETFASYLAYRARAFPATPTAPFDDLVEMIRVNTAEGVGELTDDQATALTRFRGVVADHGAVMVDGRMLPHEWLAAGARYVKTDAVDHHADHFLPGCVDVAWDLAGATIEFGLGAAEQAHLIGRYGALTGDTGVTARIGFYTVAYLAYRLGYATLAARSLAASADGPRFERLAADYRRQLAARLRLPLRAA